MIRIILPHHLRGLANVDRAVEVELSGPVSIAGLLDELELLYPVLRGTIRDHTTKERRAFIRFFACGEDLSLEPPETLLPEQVVSGAEPFRVVGAMAGG
jgi:hypothetical protein